MHLLEIKQVYNTNNASQLDARNARTSDYHRNCLKLRPHSRHQRTKNFRTHTNKSGVLPLSDEVTTISAKRPSSVDTGAFIRKQFHVVPEVEIQGIEVGARGGQVTGSLHPIHFLRYVACW
ncbi:hypothetical protein TNCV_4625801 [Trichonephila clavipes]|nr:hypothetical protein TNCV_4625801 [Trichonephila clavipes]